MAVPENVFGPIFVASQLENAAIDLLRLWFPTYLREIERQLGLTPVGVLKPPRVYTNRNTFEVIPGDDMPLCCVVSPGLLEEPITRERGKYTGRWSLGAGVAISAKDETTANTLAKIYGAAIRAIILQHQTILDVAIRTDWLDEDYQDLPNFEDQLQQYRSAGVYFAVEIQDVVDKYVKIGVPDADPYPPLGTVQDVIIDTGKIT